MASTAYIGIGSNLGDKILHCRRAIGEILKTDRHKLLAQSSLYKSLPIGFTDQDWFVNGVIQIETDFEPFALLQSLKSIEGRLGRRPTFRWGPRVIDLDILLFGVGRIGKIAGELGTGIRAFRDGLKSPEEKKPEEKNE